MDLHAFYQDQETLYLDLRICLKLARNFVIMDLYAFLSGLRNFLPGLEDLLEASQKLCPHGLTCFFYQDQETLYLDLRICLKPARNSVLGVDADGLGGVGGLLG